MLSLVNPGQRVPRDHPLRGIKQLADAALQALSPVFDEMYAAEGHPSVPPERLLKATLLIAFYSVRSDRGFCEQLVQPALSLVSRHGHGRGVLRPLDVLEES
jgi:hypothetical protein